MLADMGDEGQARTSDGVLDAARQTRRARPRFISAASNALRPTSRWRSPPTRFSGAGYTVDFPVERMMRDEDHATDLRGTNQIRRV